MGGVCKFWKFIFLLFSIPSFISAFSLTEDCGTIEEDPRDIRTSAPWTAAIFARTSNKQPFRFHISGVIVGPSTVLTIFAGVYGEGTGEDGKYFISPPENHVIGVSLKSNDLLDRDKHSQFSRVSYILPYNDKNPDNKEFHFFLFHLQNPLNLTGPYARAACLPMFLKSTQSMAAYFGPKAKARQGGFSSVQSELKVINIQMQSEEFCSNSYKMYYRGSSSHTYCGKIDVQKKGETHCTLHGSASLASLHNNKWYIIGITALIPTLGRNNWCSDQTIYFYGKLIDSLDWISKSINCSPTKFACGDGKCIHLRKLCDQQDNCGSSEDEDPIFCRGRKPCIFGQKTFECGVYGECIKPSQVCNSVKDCKNGEDEDEKYCKAKNSPIPKTPAPPEDFEVNDRVDLPKCNPLQEAEGVDIECSLPRNNEKVNCLTATVNSTAKFKCSQFYKPSQASKTMSMTCHDNGIWKPFRPFGCESDCGIIDSDFKTQQYVVHGKAVTRKDAFPWHATFYRRKSEDDEFQFICGGSLIEKSIVVTAAHCVTDGIGGAVPESNFKIVLGATYSSFRKNERDKESQIFGVKKVWIPPSYDRRILQSDIALVKLDGSAKYGERVRPICYLSNPPTGDPEAGILGKVSGFGYNEKQQISETLHFVELPVVAPEECSTSLSLIDRVLPLNTFCAGYKNGTSVCQGDSGGGMVFKESNDEGSRYFIKGIVSHGQVKEGRLCDHENVAVFTSIDNFADWILKKMEDELYSSSFKK